MAIGKVKWFNNAKGYGFVIADSGGEDLFVHYSAIQMDGYKTLKAGQGVEFDIEHGPKGLHAVNIRSSEVETPPATVATDTRSREAERFAQSGYSSGARTELAQSR
jgi:CspA family cold shock protein